MWIGLPRGAVGSSHSSPISTSMSLRIRCSQSASRSPAPCSAGSPWNSPHIRLRACVGSKDHWGPWRVAWVGRPSSRQCSQGGAIIIGFLPWNVYHTEHGVVALMLFYMGTLWCVAVTVTTLLASGWTPDAKRILAIRGAPAGMTASALALWIHHATIAFAIFDDDFDMSLYLERPQDMMAFCTDSAILGRHGDLAAMWEAIMVVAMLGTVATFLPLFRDSAKMPRDGVLSDDEDVIE